MIADKIKKARIKLTSLSQTQTVAIGIYGATAVGALFFLIALTNILNSN